MVMQSTFLICPLFDKYSLIAATAAAAAAAAALDIRLPADNNLVSDFK